MWQDIGKKFIGELLPCLAKHLHCTNMFKLNAVELRYSLPGGSILFAYFIEYMKGLKFELPRNMQKHG